MKTNQLSELLDYAESAARENAILTIRAEFGEAGKVDGYFDLHPRFVRLFVDSIQCAVEDFADFKGVKINEKQRDVVVSTLRKKYGVK